MSNVVIEPTSPWGRDEMIERNRTLGLMPTPGQRDVDHGTPFAPINPTGPRRRPYQPDLHLPGPAGMLAPLRVWPLAAALGLVAAGAALLGAVT